MKSPAARPLSYFIRLQMQLPLRDFWALPLHDLVTWITGNCKQDCHHISICVLQVFRSQLVLWHHTATNFKKMLSTALWTGVPSQLGLPREPSYCLSHNAHDVCLQTAESLIYIECSDHDDSL